jgi:hypothetical protein
MDIASYSLVYPHPTAMVSGVLLANVASFGYSLLGTLCCIGLFIMVMAAVIFAAVLYRRRRSNQILAMRAMLQQQPLAFTQDEVLNSNYDESSSYGLAAEMPEPDVQADTGPEEVTE